jgi:isopentenyl diphosphate isomerase/L-lactate dehydrogenase-like FMN-dependent dehydrogenase
MTTPHNIADYEALARARMDAAAFDYFYGGAGDERTLQANQCAFGDVWIRPRVLVDVSRVDLTTTLLGRTLPMPILLAPTAYQRLAHPEGEVATARGAGRHGALMVLSTMSTRTIEDVAAAAAGPLWFQLYVHKDRGVTRHFLERAAAAGFGAVVLTVDTPILGQREPDVRNGFVLPADMPPANFLAAYPEYARPGGADGKGTLRSHALGHLDASLTWRDVEWLRSVTRLPVVLKGILDPEDARRAVAAGAAAVIVSNHGGRQLDGAEATVRALPAVVDAVAGATPVLMDGGIRRGTDVLKALALGASAVLIGRPYLWGLAVSGDEGVAHVLELLKSELEAALALAGCPSISSVDRAMVRTEFDGRTARPNPSLSH